jgi:hypothetical protein
VRAPAAIVVAVVALGCVPAAAAYSWPLRPFDRPHPIRGDFGDPRYHLDADGEISAFHSGVDISAPDGSRVYSVSPGFVVRVHATSVTVGRVNGHRYGYWHIHPVVRSGQYIRRHQLIGRILPGWGHVHFSESVRGIYRNPLRRGALTPFYDRTVPVVSSIQLRDLTGAPIDASHVTGAVNVLADIYDLPPLPPPYPWDVARLAPAAISWRLLAGTETVIQGGNAVDFRRTLPDGNLYDWIYAPLSWQNKAHRPGQYLYWVVHGLDTTGLPDGTYRLEVYALDTRRNLGGAYVDFAVTNGGIPPPPLVRVFRAPIRQPG